MATTESNDACRRILDAAFSAFADDEPRCLDAIMTQAQSHGLLDGRPPELAEQFAGLLWGASPALAAATPPPGSR